MLSFINGALVMVLIHKIENNKRANENYFFGFMMFNMHAMQAQGHAHSAFTVFFI